MLKNIGLSCAALVSVIYSAYVLAIYPGAGQAQMRNNMQQMQQNKEQIQQMQRMKQKQEMINQEAMEDLKNKK